MSGTMLTIKNINTYYGQLHALKNVSLHLNEGEIVTLIGTNGAGKTTSFYMIVGMIRPNAGSVFLNGQDITGKAMYQRARLGISYLPQEPSIFRGLSVEKIFAQFCNCSISPKRN